MEKIRLSQEIDERISELLSLTQTYSEESTAVHKMEKGLLECMLQLGLTLLSFIISSQVKSP